MGILNNEAVLSVDVKESGEKFVMLDPGEFVLETAYFNQGFSRSRHQFLREGVLERLREAVDSLRQKPGCADWNIKIWDGYRTLAVQRFLYNYYFGQLKIEHPDWSLERLHEAAQIFVSPPSNDPSMPPPHNTGGAVDLTLVDGQGRELAMGTEFDEFDTRSFTNHFCSDCTSEYHQNRMFLKQLLTDVGLVNYSEEWWHYSYGDLEWARQTGAKESIYGGIADLEALLR